MKEKKESKQITEIIRSLSEILEDQTVPKNIRIKVENSIKALKENENDISIGVDKAIQELDDVADDPNIEQYTRTQIWGIVSMLEKI